MSRVFSTVHTAFGPDARRIRRCESYRPDGEDGGQVDRLSLDRSALPYGRYLYRAGSLLLLVPGQHPRLFGQAAGSTRYPSKAW
jgi:hypothetical protein